MAPHRIVVATGDALGDKLAGPGIRAWNLSAQLVAAGHDVRLASTTGADRPGDGFTCETATTEDAWRELAAWGEVLVLQGYLLDRYAFLADSDLVVVADLYDPFHLEQLELYRLDNPAVRADVVGHGVWVLNEQIRRADLLLCASERQRQFWLGHLSALQRINPDTYDDDPLLRRLIDVVPFGVPADPPTRTGPGPRDPDAGVDGIGPEDLVLLWGGGIYNWFDPLTLLRAVDAVRADLPSLRLLFLGGGHPNPEIDEMRVAVEARALAAELDLLGTHVFFNEGWVPYDERQNHFLDADVGVSTHLDHVETALSFRTRILDYLWCGLPIVCTAGDALADLVEARDLGRTVPAGDVDALADALRDVLADPDRRRACGERARALAADLSWDRVAAPLVAFCADPRRAPDAARTLRPPLPEPLPPVPTRAEVLAAAWDDGGVLLVLRRLAGGIKRRLQRSLAHR